MSRTRLRGIELGGIRIAIEAPAGMDWGRQPDGPAAAAAAPEGAEVYVGVRTGAAPRMPADAIVYETPTHRLAVAERGEDWVVSVRGPDGHERTALFDEGFTQGEVVLTPAALERGIQPLAHPLDELLVLHRTVRAGGLVLQGSVVRRGDRALVFLGGQRPAGGSPESRTSWRPVRSRHLRGQRIVVRPSIEGIRVLALPTCSPDPLPAGRSARLDAIHAIRPSRAVFADRLGPDDAICELLESTFAPIHDPLCADRSFGAAADIIDRVPVVRLGLPDQEQVVPFTWGRAGAALAFAPPFVV